jgi:hypothetical protein
MSPSSDAYTRLKIAFAKRVDLVSSVHFRFSEGFKTANLQSTKLLLDEWT